jgi:DNA-binding transcriptional MocR family regulator
MAKVFELGLFDAHVAALRDVYREKLAAMLAAADQHLATIDGVRFERPKGGLYVWLQTPDRLDTGTEAALFPRAMERGVLYVPGRYCYPSEGVAARDNMIRLSFGVQSPGKIRRGIEALGAAMREVMAE